MWCPSSKLHASGVIIQALTFEASESDSLASLAWNEAEESFLSLAYLWCNNKTRYVKYQWKLRQENQLKFRILKSDFLASIIEGTGMNIHDL